MDRLCFIPLTFGPRSIFGNLRAPVRVTVNGYTEDEKEEPAISLGSRATSVTRRVSLLCGSPPRWYGDGRRAGRLPSADRTEST
jgi:hypothetical protein